jgi:hypothetical protein
MNNQDFSLLSEKQKVLLGLDIVSRVLHIYTNLYPDDKKIPHFFAVVREKVDIASYPASYFDKEFREAQKDYYLQYDKVCRNLEKHYPHSSAAIAALGSLIEASRGDVLRASRKAIEAVKIMSSIEPCEIEAQAHSELLAAYIANPHTSPPLLQHKETSHVRP